MNTSLNISKSFVLLFVSIIFLTFLESILFILGVQEKSGQFNPLLSPIFFGFIFLFWLDKPWNEHIPFWIGLVSLLLIVSFIGLSINIKLIRDVIYISIFYLLTNQILYRQKLFPNHFGGNLRFILTIFVIIQCFILILFWSYLYDGYRLSLNSLSNTNSALVLYFVFFSYILLKLKHYKKIFFLGLILIFLSGSRAAFFLYSLTALFYLEYFIKSIRKQIFFLIILVVCILATSLFFINSINEVLTGIRILSFSDTEVGSISTRLNWYLSMFKLIKQNIIGGYGPGFAENNIGKLVHNDALRFWIDYSIFFLLIFLLSQVYILYANNQYHSINVFVRKRFKTILLILLNIFILSLYNGYQDLVLVINYSLFLSVLSIKNKFYDQQN